ncbi:MAG: hypothetical protein C4521_09010 [Actinobacteria bacterium]|nr:MAG: hypothetical protein C4521_09010 [Actinomycetota bacterium]
METIFLVVILSLAIWSYVWKLLAFWHSARRGDKGWFVVLAVLNTVGILEIIYLAFVAKIFTGEKPADGGDER